MLMNLSIVHYTHRHVLTRGARSADRYLLGLHVANPFFHSSKSRYELPTYLSDTYRYLRHELPHVCQGLSKRKFISGVGQCHQSLNLQQEQATQYNLDCLCGIPFAIQVSKGSSTNPENEPKVD